MRTVEGGTKKYSGGHQVAQDSSVGKAVNSTLSRQWRSHVVPLPLDIPLKNRGFDALE